MLSLFLSVDVAVPRREVEAGFGRRVEAGVGLDTVEVGRVAVGLLTEVRDVAGLVAPPLSVEVKDVRLAGSCVDWRAVGVFDKAVDLVVDVRSPVLAAACRAVVVVRSFDVAVGCRVVVMRSLKADCGCRVVAVRSFAVVVGCRVVAVDSFSLLFDCLLAVNLSLDVVAG